MKERLSSNCVGFVYNKLGMLPEEKYIDPPTLKELLKSFDNVRSVEKANVLAIITFSHLGSYLSHMAIICDDKKTILHRNGDGGEVVCEEINSCLDRYLVSNLDERHEYYLIPKPNKEKKV
jgi:hypothetical protein